MSVSVSSSLRLRADGISLNYNRQGAHFPVVDSVTLALRVGEFSVLVGPSGCGKSSFLRILAGLERPTSGRIEQDEAPVNGPGSGRAVVFQSYANFPWLRAQDNVTFGLSLRGTPRSAALQTSAELLEAVGLAEHAMDYPHQLSGGMQQRLAIARALAVDPPVLLMDEPFGALDPITRRAMQQLVRRLVADRSTTIVFVTHDTEEAVFLGDRVFVFSPRPARIVREIEIPLPERNLELIETPRFRELEAEVQSALREGIRSTVGLSPVP